MVVSQKIQFRRMYPYFVLLWFVVSGMFNGISTIFFGSAKFVSVGTVLVFGLFCLSSKTRLFTKKEIIFASFYLFLTGVVLIIYSNNNHYGLVKLIKNMVLTIIMLFDFVILYKEFYDYQFNSIIKRIFTFQILLELGLYILFVLFNKNNGMLGKSVIQIFVFQDWSGRFQGTFSEPSLLGVWLGAAAFISFFIYKNKICKLFLFCICVYILFTACKAKFALIALPFALILSCFRKLSLRQSNKMGLAFICFFTCVVALFFQSVVYSFFTLLKKTIEVDGSATYVTRFGFLFASIEDACLYPLGRGIGLNYEVFQNLFSSIIPIVDKIGLDTFELKSYAKNPNNMGSKDTFSFLLSQFGFLGIYVYFDFFKTLLSKKYIYQFFSLGLIFFLLLESIVTTNMFTFPVFFIFLFTKILLNSIAKENA